MQAYYDTEWGMPVRDERGMFERISLEAFQSGLSWATILRKRPAFRRAFDDFDPDRVAAYDERVVDRLMGDAGIVRNRRKIEATITNARATVALREEGGLVDLVWSFRPAVTPAPTSYDEVPTQLLGVGGAVQGAAEGRLHVRGADHDVRAHGGRRHRGHPPGRQPPPRILRRVDLSRQPGAVGPGPRPPSTEDPHVIASVENAVRGLLFDKVPRNHRQDPRPFLVRRIVTAVFVVVGAGVLAWSWPSSRAARFYLATLLLRDLDGRCLRVRAALPRPDLHPPHDLRRPVTGAILLGRRWCLRARGAPRAPDPATGPAGRQRPRARLGGGHPDPGPHHGRQRDSRGAVLPWRPVRRHPAPAGARQHAGLHGSPPWPPAT